MADFSSENLAQRTWLREPGSENLKERKGTRLYIHDPSRRKQ